MQKKIIFNLIIMILISTSLTGMQKENTPNIFNERSPMVMDSQVQLHTYNCCDYCWQNVEDPCGNCDGTCCGLTKCLLYSCLFTAYACFCIDSEAPGGIA